MAVFHPVRHWDMDEPSGRKERIMRTLFMANPSLKTGIAVLLALLFAVRVVAQPMVLATPEPGLMAICSGGQIVYVSMETGLPVKTGEGGQIAADPCPFSGVTAFDLSSDPFALAFFAVHRPMDAWPDRFEPVKPLATRQNTARAPPVQG